MPQIDPWEKAADCERALRITVDPIRRETLSNIREFWIALAQESRFLSDDALAPRSRRSAASTLSSTATEVTKRCRSGVRRRQQAMSAFLPCRDAPWREKSFRLHIWIPARRAWRGNHFEMTAAGRRNLHLAVNACGWADDALGLSELVAE